MMRNTFGEPITAADYAPLLQEALPLLGFSTDPVQLGGWNGGDLISDVAMLLSLAHERNIRLSDHALAGIEHDARLALKDSYNYAIAEVILGHIEAIRALDEAA